jgi:hypothetical protein
LGRVTKSAQFVLSDEFVGPSSEQASVGFAKSPPLVLTGQFIEFSSVAGSAYLGKSDRFVSSDALKISSSSWSCGGFPKSSGFGSTPHVVVRAAFHSFVTFSESRRLGSRI